ncbi:MAG: GIY-YIG nuclease family protein [Candidatus Paceibacterota bacterium]
MKTILKNKIKALPKKPGVYIFKDKNEKILYIGKAINIKKRIESHFSRQENASINFYKQVADLDFIETPSEKDALILERKLVRQYQPKYNIELKDDKDFLYIAFTDEKYPRVLLTHQTKKFKADFVGPFVDAKEIKHLLLIIRRIFPYRTCKNKPEKPCLYYHLGLCSAHNIEVKKYIQVVNGLKTFLRLYNGEKTHIECYDISNTQGSLSVGSMVTFIGNKPNKNLYRKFKIKTIKGANDPASIKEIIERRLNHKEWKYPDLIIIDGGKSQISQLKTIKIPMIALAKLNVGKLQSVGNNPHHYNYNDRSNCNGKLINDVGKKYKRSQTKGLIYSPYSKSPISLSQIPEDVKNTLLSLRNEAHRFAIRYHRLRRSRTYTD